MAGVGIVINTATALLFLRGQAQDLNIHGAFLHMVGDALVSLGVVIAGLLAWRFGWTWLDPVVSLGIVGVIVLRAIMIGLGRAVGETMILLMCTGNTAITSWSVFNGMRTLAANIAVEMPESEVGSSHYRVLFLAAFVLFVFTFFFNTLAEFVRQRLREKYSSM